MSSSSNPYLGRTYSLSPFPEMTEIIRDVLAGQLWGLSNRSNSTQEISTLEKRHNSAIE